MTDEPEFIAWQFGADLARRHGSATRILTMSKRRLRAEYDDTVLAARVQLGGDLFAYFFMAGFEDTTAVRS